MRNTTPPWEREEPTPVTTYTVALDGEQYELDDADVVQTLSEVGARVTAVMEGQR